MQCYFISSFIVIVYCLQQYGLAQTTTVRPYKFGFTIEEQQHRYEKRDERGIVMGEFGFITADGIYHVTVYATDEQGRFRILAMKNYPYESPPKSVEVLVKPKIPITTTQKPVLTRHNFNTEACSGCFLKSGKNKGPNVDGNVKTEIRTLSQALPEPSNLPSPAQPKSAIGKNVGSLLDPTFKANVNILNTLEPLKYNINNNNIFENAKNTQSQINSITPHQHHAMEQTPTTLPTKHSNGLETYSVAHSSQTLVDDSQQFPQSHIENNSNDENIFTDTTKSVIQSLENPLKIQSNFEDILNTAQAKTPSISQTQTPIIVDQQITTPTGLNYNDVALTGNIETKYTPTQTVQDPIKTTNNIRKDKPYLRNDFKYKDIVNSAQVAHVATAISGIIGNTAFRQTQTLNTGAQENTAPIRHSNEELNPKINMYTQTQAKENPTERRNTILVDNPYLQNDIKHKDILNSAQTVRVPKTITAMKHTHQPTTTLNSNENLALSTTSNKYTGNILLKITPLPVLDKSHTTEVFSKATTPITKGPTSNAPTGNSPAIMDIIIGKVLPTLMAKKVTTTTSNAKSNVAPSSKVAGSTASFIPTAGNPTSKSSSFNSNTNKGNFNPSSGNGDGDLYRFKYILDYHGHTETGKRNGNKEGNYFAIGDDNVERTVEYVANENGYQPHIRWRKLNQNESKPNENTLKDYEFVWLSQ